MPDKITTADCKEAIAEWYAKNNNTSPGEFKRIKKFKDLDGNWIRVFEHEPSGTIMNVFEHNNTLLVKSADALPGKDYLFAFCEDETYGEDSEATCFVVCEKSYFQQHGHMNSVHFTDTFEMPEIFEEMQESCFLVELTEDETRRELFALGFTESKELAELFQ